MVIGRGETENEREYVEGARLARINWYIVMEGGTKPIDLVGAESRRGRRKDSARRMGVSV